MHLGRVPVAWRLDQEAVCEMLPWHAKTHPNCAHEGVSLVLEGTGSARPSLYEESNGGDE